MRGGFRAVSWDQVSDVCDVGSETEEAEGRREDRGETGGELVGGGGGRSLGKPGEEVGIGGGTGRRREDESGR